MQAGDERVKVDLGGGRSVTVRGLRRSDLIRIGARSQREGGERGAEAYAGMLVVKCGVTACEGLTGPGGRGVRCGAHRDGDLEFSAGDEVIDALSGAELALVIGRIMDLSRPTEEQIGEDRGN